MAEQVELAILSGAEPPRHGLRSRVLTVDAVDDPVDLETVERPIDCRPRRLHRVALATEIARDTPADFETRPAQWHPGTDASDKSAGLPFLHHQHPDAVQRPVARHDRRVTPPGERVGDGFVVGGNET